MYKSYLWEEATGRVPCLGEGGGTRAVLVYRPVRHTF